MIELPEYLILAFCDFGDRLLDCVDLSILFLRFTPVMIGSNESDDMSRNTAFQRKRRVFGPALKRNGP